MRPSLPTPTTTVVWRPLPRCKPNYAPAKAGDEMLLTAAYDAAKTAAQAGDEMLLTAAYDAAKTAAQAGDEMLLTAAYDAAKTAAQAGDAMTLGNDAVSAASLANDALAEIKAEVEAVLATTARAELIGVPAANASLADKLTWIAMLLRNKRTQDDSTETVYADDGTTPLATSDKDVTGGVMTRGEYTDVP